MKARRTRGAKADDSTRSDSVSGSVRVPQHGSGRRLPYHEARTGDGRRRERVGRELQEGSVRRGDLRGTSMGEQGLRRSRFPPTVLVCLRWLRVEGIPQDVAARIDGAHADRVTCPTDAHLRRPEDPSESRVCGHRVCGFPRDRVGALLREHGGARHAGPVGRLSGGRHVRTRRPG